MLEVLSRCTSPEVFGVSLYIIIQVFVVRILNCICKSMVTYNYKGIARAGLFVVFIATRRRGCLKKKKKFLMCHPKRSSCWPPLSEQDPRDSRCTFTADQRCRCHVFQRIYYDLITRQWPESLAAPPCRMESCRDDFLKPRALQRCALIDSYKVTDTSARCHSLPRALALVARLPLLITPRAFHPCGLLCLCKKKKKFYGGSRYIKLCERFWCTMKLFSRSAPLPPWAY